MPPAFPATPTGGGEARFPVGGFLWLTARDPFCLCVHWSFDSGALAAFASAHPGGGWWLRLRAGSVEGWMVHEQPLPLGVEHRFVPVMFAGASYVAEVGFRHADGSWQRLVFSSPASTPQDGLGVEGPLQSVSLVTMDPWTATPLQEQAESSTPAVAPRPEWSLPGPPEMNRLTSLLWEPHARQPAPSSQEVTEWLAREITAIGTGLAAPAALAGGEGFGVSSGLPASERVHPPPVPGFWFKVNAELVIHGSTERDARVTIAGRRVSLREDGSFSFRFALPDGDFTLPVVAVNAAGTDGRSAKLQFTRATLLSGEVGEHPRDPRLKPPVAEAIG